ncbi:MAG: DNA helicase RecQ [Rhodospirillales bacterium]|nr:DNA helicase RecQ [Rhodospirillales bacterium]MBT4626404.1 DNA helicase RecQ [Rhodospirillales bacterium]MBT5522106.1 DNA helicase RecQ [Rhodospirillales bacterium]MBT6110082.1 DNA helicase RecQ [Rhodospirillales bacterium]MBT7147008.1 DNA helicase RecQ [Rhodospirillales bacterium]
MPEQILKNVFGYDSFRAGQLDVVNTLVARENALIVMPTGSGKSLCFQVPSLLMGGLTIVVSPLVALMEDQVAALKLAGVDADTINSSRERQVNVAAWKKAAAGETRLLYMAPERLMTDRMLDALSQLPVKLIAVDEAHCMSRWGPSFRPEYEALSRLQTVFPDVPIAALTATADKTTQDDIATKLFGGPARHFVSSFDRPNIQLNVEMRGDAKRQLLDVVQAHKGESGIVYCLSRAKTEKMAQFLNDNGVAALPYHAGMSAEARTKNQTAFMTDDETHVMVATIAFGMGIDKPDVRYVCHTDMPGNVESYYQEIGRAGRDGKPSEAHMFYGLDDLRMRRMFIEQDDGDTDHKRREHKRLDALISYCESPECRRRALLAYFGEQLLDNEGCGNCDVCINPPHVVDGTTPAQQLLSAAVRTGQMFGQAHLIDIVRGADTEKIRSSGHDNLPTYGIGADLAKDEWRSIVRQLVAASFLIIDVAGHGGLSLTEKGQALLKGEQSFNYRKDVIKRSAKHSKARRDPSVALDDLSPEQHTLLDRLRDKRTQLAKERNVPAFMIFSDRSLEDMAREQPASEPAFADIHGVGAAKLRDFAGDFLGVIANQ